jgi:hypothetical protein
MGRVKLGSVRGINLEFGGKFSEFRVQISVRRGRTVRLMRPDNGTMDRRGMLPPVPGSLLPVDRSDAVKFSLIFHRQFIPKR